MGMTSGGSMVNRDRYRKIFTRLDPSRGVTSANFREAGYVGYNITGLVSLHGRSPHAPDGFAILSTILQWCSDNFGQRYAWVESSIWFTDDEDAFLFRLTWMP
jgi:hypothetical protein